ncbi:MAG: CvpA family protein [Candidatus Parcubacteria bacterium]|nr:CvpA family protein [Candidatus Parcubacteria bacterium]
MTIFDVILLICLGGFVLFGLWFGFIHTLGSLVGTFGGAFLAGQFYGFLANWLAAVFGNPNLMKIFSFILIFIIINRLIGFGFYALDKMFNFMTIVPFLKTINRLLGGFLGFFEGLLVVGLSLFIISRFPVSEWFTGVLQASTLAGWFIAVSVILQMMLPELLRQLKSVI